MNRCDGEGGHDNFVPGRGYIRIIPYQTPGSFWRPLPRPSYLYRSTTPLQQTATLWYYSSSTTSSTILNNGERHFEGRSRRPHLFLCTARAVGPGRLRGRRQEVPKARALIHGPVIVFLVARLKGGTERPAREGEATHSHTLKTLRTHVIYYIPGRTVVP